MESFNISIIEKLWGERLDSSRFTWLNHSGVLGMSSMDILNVVRSDGSLRIVNHRFDVIGWCYGSSLLVRPSVDSIAVMFWDNDEKQEIWCHVTRTLNVLFCIRRNIDKSVLSLIDC